MYFNRAPMTDKDLGFWLRSMNLLQKQLDELQASRKGKA